MLCTSLVLSLLAVQQSDQAPPSVLVMVLDDVGWSERSSMPALDTLAAQGMTFTRAYSWPVCSPSRAAALYGILPRRVRLGDVLNVYNPPASAPNVAPEHWRASLFDALPTHESTLIGKWHLGRASDGGEELLSVACGFSLSGVIEAGPFVAGAAHWLAGSPNSIGQGPGSTGYFDWYRVDDSLVRQNHSTYATDAQRDAFLQWWDETEGPRFAWLAWSAAHAPFDPPPGRALPAARGVTTSRLSPTSTARSPKC